MGSNSPLYTPNIGTSVKTGTTNDFKDNWTVGYTRNVAVGVWVGNSDGAPMNNVSGLAGAAPIWNAVINEIWPRSRHAGPVHRERPVAADRLDAPARHVAADAVRRGNSARPGDRLQLVRGRMVPERPGGLPDGLGNVDYPAAPAQRLISAPSGPWLREFDGVPSSPTFINSAIARHFRQFNVPPGRAISPPPICRECRSGLVSSDPAAARTYFLTSLVRRGRRAGRAVCAQY
ncbi:MAG: hypothetical protein U0452_12010 [Anaerolineae bacterium]